MTSPAREATRIRCPGCGSVYDEWWHATLELALEIPSIPKPTLEPVIVVAG